MSGSFELQIMASPDGSGPTGWVQWFLTTEEGTAAYVRDVLTSAGAVLLVGALLFGVSGIWPPMVAIESGSMNPHLQKGDLAFVMEEHRLAPSASYKRTGVQPASIARHTSYIEFNQPGDVIVYQPDGSTTRTPIIHRARFWVNASENWYQKANSEFLASADNCAELANCPAPHAGFITKGDANPQYDQVDGGYTPISDPVKTQWIIGTAEFRIPYLGWVRLGLASVLVLVPFA